MASNQNPCVSTRGAFKTHTKKHTPMGKQQTAVEWLFLMLNDPNKNQEFAHKLLEKALEMEKEQITTAYLTGIMHPLQMEATKQSEQYYNETYRK
jgi:hypothetical protein